MPVVKNKIVDVVVMYFSCFFNKVVTWFIQILLHITSPFTICKHHIIQHLKLYSHICEHILNRVQIRWVFISLANQVL